jgi:hypothetical protein
MNSIKAPPERAVNRNFNVLGLTRRRLTQVSPSTTLALPERLLREKRDKPGKGGVRLPMRYQGGSVKCPKCLSGRISFRTPSLMTRLSKAFLEPEKGERVSRRYRCGACGFAFVAPDRRLLSRDKPSN